MLRTASIDRIVTEPGWRNGTTAISAVTPLLLLPLSVYCLCSRLPAWQLMWLLAVSIYAALKWLTFATCPLARPPSAGRALAYLLLWPGMNAKAFFNSNSQVATPTISESLLAVLKLALGIVLLFAVAPMLTAGHALIAGWTGMTGLIFVLHFGLFHILSICWRMLGINAEPIMRFPMLATSLNDFWGRRWNLAFRDLAFRYILRPLVGRVGVAEATMAVFLFSGLVHDLVISLPVNNGWGGPTIYFAAQGAGMLLERSDLGLRLGLGNGFVGRLFCGLITICPVGLLFHPPFVLEAILPPLTALRFAWMTP